MGSFRHSTIDLRGHTVIGTGASSGTGADTALGCASADGNTAVNYSGNRQGAERIVKEIEDLGVRAFYHQADVRREEDVQAMARTAVDTWGTWIFL